MLPRKKLDPGAPAAGVARVFYWPAFWFDLGKAGAAFYFHDLVAQKGGAFEFEIGGSALHLVFQLAQQLGQVEIATGVVNY